MGIAEQCGFDCGQEMLLECHAVEKKEAKRQSEILGRSNRGICLGAYHVCSRAMSA